MESIEYNFFVSVIVVCYTYTVFLIYNMFMTAYESRNKPRYITSLNPIMGYNPQQQQPQKKANRVDTINKEIQKQEKILRDLLREKSKEQSDGEIIV